MAEQYSVAVSAVALSAATAKTVVELATGATIDNTLISLDVSFNGVTSTAVPVLVEVITTAATGTGTAATPNRVGPNQGRPSLTTAKTNLTVEGSTPVVVWSWYVPPTSGFSYLWPLGRELSMGPSKFLGIRCTAPAAVSAAVTLAFEE